MGPRGVSNVVRQTHAEDPGKGISCDTVVTKHMCICAAQAFVASLRCSPASGGTGFLLVTDWRVNA